MDAYIMDWLSAVLRVFLVTFSFSVKSRVSRSHYLHKGEIGVTAAQFARIAYAVSEAWGLRGHLMKHIQVEPAC